METDYVSHDSAYLRLKAEGAFGWTSEADHQVVRSRVLEILEQRSLRPGSRVLDLGCGTGDLASWLAQQGYEAYGIDIAPTAIAWATEKAQAHKAHVQFTVGSVLTLSPYDDGFFQFIIDGRCLHCIIGPDRPLTLSNIFRVLQPGGGFLLQSMCGEVMEESPMRANFDPESGCIISNQGIATRYIGDASVILQELTTAGFEIAQHEVIPRQGPDDQDDLVAIAIKPPETSL